jgi:hypothetical protein
MIGLLRLSVPAPPYRHLTIKTPHDPIVEAVAKYPLLAIKEVLPCRFIPVTGRDMTLELFEAFATPKQYVDLLSAEIALQSVKHPSSLLARQSLQSRDKASVISVDNCLAAGSGRNVFDLKRVLVASINEPNLL